METTIMGYIGLRVQGLRVQGSRIYGLRFRVFVLAFRV